MKSAQLSRAGSILLTSTLAFGILVGDAETCSVLGGFLTSTEAKNANQTSAQGEGKKSKVSHDLQRVLHSGARSEELIDVILQFKGGNVATDVINFDGVQVKRDFPNLSAKALRVPAGLVEQLAAHSGVTHLSLNKTIKAFGDVTATTGVDAARQAVSDSSGMSLDGAGLRIAVVDSGVDANHHSFRGQAGGGRVVVSRDFTGEGRTDDPFGHGTHVASTVAGSKLIFNGAYGGIAPAADLVNLRVLGAQGTGQESSLLSALDWVLSNKDIHNIRVVNLSLGTPAVESFREDPVCIAVRRLVNTGVVVAVAAGNNGKDANNIKLYGGIGSPGIEPSAITVGASNTFQTVARGDDTVTTYSSR
ncbi:MAG TPA: S8 family serine peptidase, partial [Pyrinomonadaceae bacterium]|nr:S8 family serine peptidase [Pyrinomonadaceae bacterium]